MKLNRDTVNGESPSMVNTGALSPNAQQTPNDSQICVDFTIFNSITPPTLTKERRLSADGQLVSSTSAHMSEGTATTTTVNSATQLAGVLDKLEHNQAVSWGVPASDMQTARILSKAAYEKAGTPADALTRTNEHFRYANGHGVKMLDCDDTKLSKEQFINAINDALGDTVDLSELAHVWRPSSSSYIYNGDEQVTGLKGQRLYLMVKDANDIPRALNVLFSRLWLNGHGYYEISAAGTLLERAPIDTSVGQASRLDFAAGSKCIAPLEQRSAPTEPHEGALLDTATALPDLTADEQAELQAIKEREKAKVRDEADDVKAKYCREKALINLAEHGIDNPTAEQIETARANVRRALDGHLLTGDYVIQLDNGDAVTVGEVLDNPAKYHGAITKDPLEPEYDGSRSVGKLYLYDGRPNLYSMAHGGRAFRLVRQPQRIEHTDGKTTDTTQRALDLLKALPDYFDMGDKLVSVKDGAIISFDIHALAFELGSVAQFYRCTSKGEKDIDPPEKVIKQIMSLDQRRDLNPLNAVITAPTITANDYIVSKHGYDKGTRLYLDNPHHGVEVPLFVSTDDAVAAYKELMKPFDTFDYADDLSRSVALSAVLTAVTRPTLEKAPAFAFDAPKQGSGKTYFCECLGLLATGERPTPMPSIENNEDELRKTLFAMLLAGKRVVIWDNIMGDFNSATMATFLTNVNFPSRMLGKSELIEISHRAMLLLTGNNITLVGDMPRRVFTCRFDTGLENPTNKQRDLSAIDGFKPYDYIEQHRQKLVAAALTLIRGYLQSDANNTAGAVSIELSSFEDWDTVARQPVVWLAEYVDGLTDPKQVIDDKMQTDPEHEALSGVLAGIYDWSQGAPFTAAELYKSVYTDLLDELFDPKITDSQKDTLADSLADLNGGKPSSVSIGRLLSNRRGRIAGGLKLELVKASRNGKTYKVIEL
jgi:hypothetical protein